MKTSQIFCYEITYNVGHIDENLFSSKVRICGFETGSKFLYLIDFNNINLRNQHNVIPHSSIRGFQNGVNVFIAPILSSC